MFYGWESAGGMHMRRRPFRTTTVTSACAAEVMAALVVRRMSCRRSSETWHNMCCINIFVR